MQQTTNLTTSTSTDLSPSFQEWLNHEKAAARNHRNGKLKWAALFLAVIAILVLKENSTLFADLFGNTGAIAQP